MVPNALQASVCDEQLMSIGGEIALSRNSGKVKKNEKTSKNRKNQKMMKNQKNKREATKGHHHHPPLSPETAPKIDLLL